MLLKWVIQRRTAFLIIIKTINVVTFKLIASL